VQQTAGLKCARSARSYLNRLQLTQSVWAATRIVKGDEADAQTMTDSLDASILPPPGPLVDDVIELRLLRTMGPTEAQQRAPEAQFLAKAPEYRFAIHLRADGQRIGRIHLRITTDPTILRALGHCGYEIDETHRRRGYATRALRLIRQLADARDISPLWILIAEANVASRRAVERVGFRLVDIADAAPDALALGLEASLCRYAAE
jgi:predicted acetyltransferase